jgi:cysteinyl-tRNA synthetase
MLKIHNSLSKEIEEFKPIESGKVKMYSCGPTVYDYPHIGNFRAFLFSDLLKRTLQYLNYEVNHVMNITDVDDKTIFASQKEGKSLSEFTEFYTNEFNKELESLNILPTTNQVKATEHVDEMVTMIETLLEKGIAYKSEDGSTYFDISKFEDYGKLSGVDTSNLESQISRVKHDEYEKDSIQDFALWKAWDESDGEVFWETSLGKGRPGWHIECSAMATKYLGNHFDIHTGGVDLKFPHHENEIAQSKCFSNEEYVNYWVHNEHILVDYKKMSKSLGNFYRLDDLKNKGYSPLDYRYFLLGASYRTKINLTWKSLDGAKSAFHKLVIFMKDNYGESGSVVDEYKNKFTEDIEDDLNTSKGLATLHELLKEKDISNSDKYATILDFDKVLGLNLENLAKEDVVPDEVQALLEKRKLARKDGDWDESDKLREEIRSLGFETADSGDDTKVRKI